MEAAVNPTGQRWLRRVALIVLLLAAVASGYAIGRSHTDTEAGAAKEMYQCPMHPTIIQDHPGECPICGMKLVKIAGKAPPGERKIKFYRSTMDAKQTSPVPRKDEMGMDYVPVYEDEVSSGSSVEGLATVDIDPARQQLIGLKTADVVRGTISGAWRTVGRVTVDETRVRHVNVKVPVYVEKVYVDFIGKTVPRGAPLFSGYSPDLLVAQQEYKIALSTRKPGQSDGLVDTARRKLELWDVPKTAIDRLETTGEVMRSMTFYSPIAGVVTKKDVVEGMKLDAGAMPYEVVDLSRVWALADVYEMDLHRVKVGMPAKLALKAYPNRVFEGTSVFIDPILDPRTRTAKLRLEFPNKEGDLKPEMFGTIVLESAPHDALKVPVDAIIDSGTKKVAFVAIGAGKFQPREVQIGDYDGQDVEIVSGLAEGEKVIVRANFLIDSESRLRASLASLSAAPTTSASSAPTATSTADATPAPTASAHAHPATTAPTATASSPAPHEQDAGTLYACPMHPEVTDTKPSRCPKCGMTLTPGGKMP